MRILVTTIPFSGMKIDAPISLESLNARLREGSTDNNIVFEEPPMADITLTRTHGGVIVKGIVAGICKQDCGTCAELVSHETIADIDWILQSPSDRAAPDDEIDDPGVIFYDGEHVELEEHLQEALILSISPFWRPERDSKERCTLCNRDCSKHTWGSSDQSSKSRGKTDSEAQKPSFGELLKGALTKKADK
jgi:uncharacterized metal-binding protein YceD (DUF177 family)